MLLVTFHGGSTGVTNVYAYDTSTGELNTDQALSKNTPLTDAELRGLVYANSYLYVVNGKKKVSSILCFQPPAAGSSSYDFTYVGQFLGPSLSSKDRFENSIGHPYAIQFYANASGTSAFVSNQDTNVVAQATVSGNFETASIAAGCQSAYLKGLTSICPKSGCVYLDGTFVASHNGTLPDVKVAATDVPSKNGGLSVSFAGSSSSASSSSMSSEGGSKPKVQNSVRDVVVSGNTLLVCDEPEQAIRVYSLPDGDYLGKSPLPNASPTHLAIFDGALYVSAGEQLYWSSLTNLPTLSFSSVLTSEKGVKIGGLAFDPATQTVWVAFQKGTGTTGTGTIYSYRPAFSSSAPPVFGAGSQLATASTNTPVFLPDTPEFLLFIPNP